MKPGASESANVAPGNERDTTRFTSTSRYAIQPLPTAHIANTPGPTAHIANPPGPTAQSALDLAGMHRAVGAPENVNPSAERAME